MFIIGIVSGSSPLLPPLLGVLIHGLLYVSGLNVAGGGGARRYRGGEGIVFMSSGLMWREREEKKRDEEQVEQRAS